MKVGLYFGSFNPIHIGHLAIANYMVEFTDLDEVWFVVSPQNPLKNKKSLLNDADRLDMVEMAIKHDNRFRASNIEFRMPKPSYTIDTLTYLRELHPSDEFVMIMGADGLPTFYKWKNYEMLVEQHERYIYPRPGVKNDEVYKHKNIKYLFDAPQFEISSSFIRHAIKQKKDIRFFLTEPVYNYIQKMHFYE